VSNMNPMEVAWLVLKAPLEGYDSNLTDEENTARRQPQQPTITDFTRYTRPQLEQMVVMFQNELMRRGHASLSSEISIPNMDRYMSGEGGYQREELDAAPTIPTDELGEAILTEMTPEEHAQEIQRLMTQLMSGETLSPEELLFLQQDGPETQQQARDAIWSNYDAVESTTPTATVRAGLPATTPTATDIPTDDAVRQILNSHGIEHHLIEPHHIRQYQGFYRMMRRHPTEEEIDAHIGD